MTVTMPVTVAMIVVIMMPMVVRLPIGAAFRVEGRHHVRHLGAEAGQHRLDDVIVADAEPIAHELGRQMTVAEMPREPEQLRAVDGRDLGEWLRRRIDLGDPAVLEEEAVAVTERRRLGQVEQEFGALLAGHGETAAMARVMGEGGPRAPAAGPFFFRGEVFLFVY